MGFRPVRALGPLAVVAALAAAPGAAADVPLAYVYLNAPGSPARVFGWSLAADGTLHPIFASPWSDPGGSGDCSGFCNAAAFAALRGVVLTATGAGVTSWSVGADGGLLGTDGSPYPFQVAELGTSVAVAQSGGRAFAYATQYYGDSMDGFEVLADGSLVRLPGLPVTGIHGVSVAGAGGDRLVYLDEVRRRLRGYVVGADGSLSGGRYAKVPGRFVYSVTVDPSGAFAWTGDWKKGRSVYGYELRPDGRPVRGAVTKLRIRDADGGISVSPTGLAAVFASTGTNDVQVFRVAKKGKLAKLGGPQSSGLRHVTAHAFSPDGRFLVAASPESGTVVVFSVDGTTGALTQTDSQTASGADTFNGIAVLTR